MNRAGNIAVASIRRQIMVEQFDAAFLSNSAISLTRLGTIREYVSRFGRRMECLKNAKPAPISKWIPILRPAIYVLIRLASDF